jgi:RNA polymerase sigma-70 factor (ECF subfamily)
MDESPPTDEAAGYGTTAHGGSREALGEALESCRAYLLLVANRELDDDLQAKGAPSDLVQDTFLEAQRDFGRFHGDSPEALRAWLRQILLHNIANFTRRFRDTNRREIAREVTLDCDRPSTAGPFQFATSDPSPSAEVMADERAAALDAAIGRLPKDYRRIIELRHGDGLSFVEISCQLGRSDNAVRKLFFRAVERLKQELDASQ